MALRRAAETFSTIRRSLRLRVSALLEVRISRALRMVSIIAQRCCDGTAKMVSQPHHFLAEAGSAIKAA